MPQILEHPWFTTDLPPDMPGYSALRMQDKAQYADMQVGALAVRLQHALHAPSLGWFGVTVGMLARS